jgi:hypothetical protein
MNALKRILNWLSGKSVAKKVTPKPTIKPQAVTPKTEIKPAPVAKVEPPKVQEAPAVVTPTPTPVAAKPAAPKRKRGPRKPAAKK